MDTNNKLIFRHKRRKTNDVVNDNALYEAILDMRWEASRRLLRSANDALRLVTYSREGISTLHRACWQNAPVDVVESIHDVDPSLVTRRDGHGFTPLLCASSDASEEVVEFLLRKAPRVAAIAPRFRGLPLHCAVEERRSPSIVRRLLWVHPTAVYAKDDDDATPLQCFVNGWRKQIERVYPDLNRLPRYRDKSVFRQTFSLLLMAHLYGTVKPTETTLDGPWLLLHQALRPGIGVPIPSVFLRAILDTTVPLECHKPDRDRNFPLHLACAQRFD